MTEEEKEAIQRLWNSVTDVIFYALYSQEECDRDKVIVLDLIKKQQAEKEQLKAELEKKDKIIYEMATTINKAYFDERYFIEWFDRYICFVQKEGNYDYLIGDIKQYFERKVER